MAFDYLTDFLLIKPKPGDSEEVRDQKNIINHAIQTYFQFSAAEKIGDNLLSQFVPKQVMVNRVTGEDIDPLLATQGAATTRSILRMLSGSRRLF